MTGNKEIGAQPLYPMRDDIWKENRDAINMVVGGILGAYLGLAISREGLPAGNILEFFFLIFFYGDCS